MFGMGIIEITACTYIALCKMFLDSLAVMSDFCYLYMELCPMQQNDSWHHP